MRRLSRVAAAVLLLLPGVLHAHAVSADSTVADRARQLLRRLESIETGLAARRDTTDLDARTRQRDLVAEARAVLDTAVLQAPDGRATLGTLQREYPGAVLLREFEAWRLLADSAPADALVRFDALLRAQRRNVPLLRGRARALTALQREPDATSAWERLLDVYPIDEEAFDALWQAAEARQSLTELHRLIVRLRLLYPNDPVILGREVRVLQGLGLPDSASAVVRRYQGGS